MLNSFKHSCKALDTVILLTYSTVKTVNLCCKQRSKK